VANVKIPYALIPAVALDVRRANQISALARGLPRLQRTPIDDQATLHLACYGPSLRETWPVLQTAAAAGQPILSMSGATKFLAERGVTPTYHLDMDPRENKVMTSLPPVPGVTYLVASCCAPAYFDALQAAHASVVLWHTVSANWEDDLRWVAAHDPGELLVSTGSTIGLGALHLGGLLGYRRFEIHGMDGSFAADGVRHADRHHGRAQKDNITWQANHVVYRTSKIMANAVAETINTAKNFPIITIWHGNGLTQALIRKANLSNACCADQADKRTTLGRLTPQIISLPPLPAQAQSPWDGLVTQLTSTDLPELLTAIPRCEARRPLARYNTGSIPLETSLLLRALCRTYQPEVIAEIGTFIGTSTDALVARRVLYTCDRDNDCVPLTDTVITHPYQTSTQMLAEISEPVDLFFFDGRIQDADLPHLQRLSRPTTIYAFDDCIDGPTGKGIANMQRLRDVFPGRVLLPPYQPWQGRSTLAAWLPAPGGAVPCS